MSKKTRNSKNSAKSKTIYGIIGLGRFGHALATELAAGGAEIMVLDNNEEKVREMREYTENAMVVQGLDIKTLSETGIQNCDVAVVCISEQMDVSILTTLNLVSLGIPRVIAKAKSAEHGIILSKLGAEVVYPERDMALRLATRLETSRVLDYMQLNEQLNISKLAIPDTIIGETVRSVNMRGKFGINIVAVENGGSVTDTVDPDYVFKKGDILIVSGKKDGTRRLIDWCEKQQKSE